MTAVEVLPANAHRYQLLRAHEDPLQNAYWCFMHAASVPRVGAYRACFTPQLIKEIREFQKHTADRLSLRASNADDSLAHVVLASDANVFNLGGDLDLFCRLIRGQRREHLLAYARQCVEGVFGFHAHLNRNAHSIALVQGDALGGGGDALVAAGV